ncbi:universal stress protein family [hydrocarbon metagenome]|uniref:Universal stress protein family n=1 Tax=hydrocarbon metagenome TaxID=938273 RepID=A0A0W8E4E5_9ZZZZ
MFKNILVLVDGSEYSINAARAAASMADQYSGKLTMLHVVGKSFSKTTMPDLEQEIAGLRSEGSQILSSAIAATGKSEDQVEAILSWGNPLDIILEEVQDKNYDLIVMGSRGLGAIKGLLMGSVSERISRSVKCPVLIVKELDQ